MKNQERSDKIKKILIFILSIIVFINTVQAQEFQDITNDVEIKYKWYKETINGYYHPLKDIKETDLVKRNDIKYGLYSDWNEKNCGLSRKYYQIEGNVIYTYKKVNDIRYVKIDNFDYNSNNLKIFYQGIPLEFEIISNENKILKLDLKKPFLGESLLFYINTNTNSKISLYSEPNFSNENLSKQITDIKAVIPDKTWITPTTEFIIFSTEATYQDSDLTTNTGLKILCQYREIYVYKYEINKEYYDENYHSYVEGYIKDINDYQVMYKGKPITNIIEKEKKILIPQIETIYLEKENNDISKEIDSSPQIIKEIIEKKIYVKPKKIYSIIIILTLIIITLSINILKKNVVKKK